MNLGELIDRRADLKVSKAEAQRVVDAIDDEVKEVERMILETMRASDVKMAAGSKAKAVIKEDLQPSVKDWDALHGYIKDNNAFYLLQKRVAATAFRDSLNAGDSIPGVEAVPVTSLSITSI